MLDCLNDELIITGHIEEGTTSSRVGEFNQWFTAKGVLKIREDIKSQLCQGCLSQKSGTDKHPF